MFLVLVLDWELWGDLGEGGVTRSDLLQHMNPSIELRPLLAAHLRLPSSRSHGGLVFRVTTISFKLLCSRRPASCTDLKS